MKRILTIIPLFALTVSCSYIDKKTEEPIAEAYGKKLYLSDIKGIFPPGIKSADSLMLLNSYIESWSRKQILISTAEENLSAEDKDVTQELDDYRATLLISRYEQQYISSRLDTNLSKEQMQRFYDENSHLFVLPASIVKALYVKIKTSSPYIPKIKELMKNSSEQGLRELESLGRQAAENFDYFNDRWVFFNDILAELPVKPVDADDYLVKNSLIEQKDTTYTYLVAVKQYRLKGNQSPFDFERENIRNIILNKKRQELIENFEQSAYNDAKRDEKIKVYIGK